VKGQSKHASIKRVEHSPPPGKKSTGKSTTISNLKTCDATDDRNCSLDDSPKKKKAVKKHASSDEEEERHHHRKPAKHEKVVDKHRDRQDQRKRERSREAAPQKPSRKLAKPIEVPDDSDDSLE